MRSAFTLLVALVACGELHPLSEVPIEGGTPEQRQVVRDELLAFDASAGEGRVLLRAVRFRPGSKDTWEGRGGSYSIMRRQVLLNDTITGAALRRIVRHELCHAVEYFEHLLSEPVPMFDTRVERFLDAGLVPDVGSARRRRGEVFAEMCEVGPALAPLLQHPCPGDPEGLGPLAGYLVDHVWTGNPPVAPSSSLAHPVAHHDLSSPPGLLLAAGAADGRSVLLVGVPSGELGGDQVWVDLETGDPVPDPGVPFDETGVFQLPAVPLPSGLAASDRDADPLSRHAVVQGERALMLVEPVAPLFEAAMGPIARRAVGLDGEAWFAVDACPSEVATVFTTPGQLWLAWAEEARVHWVPVGAPAAP